MQYDKKLFATMIINCKQLQFQLDTGATVDVLFLQGYKEISSDQTFASLSKSNDTLCMYNKAHLETRTETR